MDSSWNDSLEFINVSDFDWYFQKVFSDFTDVHLNDLDEVMAMVIRD